MHVHHRHRNRGGGGGGGEGGEGGEGGGRGGRGGGQMSSHFLDSKLHCRNCVCQVVFKKIRTKITGFRILVCCTYIVKGCGHSKKSSITNKYVTGRG